MQNIDKPAESTSLENEAAAAETRAAEIGAAPALPARTPLLARLLGDAGDGAAAYIQNWIVNRGAE